MTTLFNIAVGHDAEKNLYGAIVHSLQDDKIARVTNDKSLPVVMSQVRKLVKKRDGFLKRFPLQEPSRIIVPGSNGAPKLSRLMSAIWTRLKP